MKGEETLGLGAGGVIARMNELDLQAVKRPHCNARSDRTVDNPYWAGETFGAPHIRPTG